MTEIPLTNLLSADNSAREDSSQTPRSLQLVAVLNGLLSRDGPDRVLAYLRVFIYPREKEENVEHNSQVNRCIILT